MKQISNATDKEAETMTGPCDTTGCLNQAEVHYGLEEFYCRPCDEDNHLNQRVEAKQKRLLSLYRWKDKFMRAGRTAAVSRVDGRLSRAISQLLQLHRAGVDAFEKRWPDYCLKCRAWGVDTFYEHMKCDDCWRSGTCSRCGVASLSTIWLEEETPCPNCGWNWGKNPGDAMADPLDYM